MLMCQLDHEFSDWLAWRVNVVDVNDSIVLILPFQQVIEATEVRQKAHDSIETMH
jgi:hypothetical protein